MTHEESVVHLFWTGGWDSTYRLLHLLLEEKRPVQPHYLIDSDRRSTGAELLTMRNLKQALFKQHPETRRLLRPTMYREVSDIAPNAEITAAYRAIRERVYLGSQYDWLARYVAEEGLKVVEVCFTHHRGHTYELLHPILSPANTDPPIVYQVDPDKADQAEYKLFSGFLAPTFSLTKKEMEQAASQGGFLDLLDQSWFCHNPRGHYTPCGICPPCMAVRSEGMGRRLPASARLRFWVSPLPRIRNAITSSPRLYTAANRWRARLKRGV